MGLQNAVHIHTGNLWTAVIAENGGPWKVRQLAWGTAEDCGALWGTVGDCGDYGDCGGLWRAMGDYGGLCMNPIDRGSLHPPRTDTGIH